MALTALATRLTTFAWYRLAGGQYAGWRIRDVWRHAPQALVAAASDPATPPRDARMIALFLTLFGGIMYRPPSAVDAPAASTDDTGDTDVAASRTATTLPVSTPAFGLMADLPGQTTVLARLTVALQAAGASGGGVAVVCFALQNREALTRYVGEGGVERVVATMGARLLAHITEPGGAGRLGYGVFVAVLPLPPLPTSPDDEEGPNARLLRQARQRAETLRAMLSASVTLDTVMHFPPVWEDTDVPITVGMGLAVAPLQGMNAPTLLLRASQGISPRA